MQLKAFILLMISNTQHFGIVEGTNNAAAVPSALSIRDRKLAISQFVEVSDSSQGGAKVPVALGVGCQSGEGTPPPAQGVLRLPTSRSEAFRPSHAPFSTTSSDIEIDRLTQDKSWSGTLCACSKLSGRRAP